MPMNALVLKASRHTLLQWCNLQQAQQILSIWTDVIILHTEKLVSWEQSGYKHLTILNSAESHS